MCGARKRCTNVIRGRNLRTTRSLQDVNVKLNGKCSIMITDGREGMIKLKKN